MSFGFSIGDIVLLSQLAYNLYSSVTSASRDLKEFEDVLFSLRCALDHLGDVAKDVLAKTEAHGGHRGPDPKEHLDRIIASCGSTLQELDDVTQKYREIGIDEGHKAKHNKRGMLQRITVNWKKVQWDREKQSLHQYREKLRSHTDAINLILISVIWSHTSSAEANSKANHDKTHSLLDQVLKSPQMDATIQQMMREIHGMLVQTTPQASTMLPPMARSHVSGASPAVYDAACAPANRLASRSTESQQSFDPGSLVFERLLEPPCEPQSVFSVQPTSTPIAVTSVLAYHTPPAFSSASPPSLVSLNNERRAFAVREFDAFVKRHVPPAQQTFPYAPVTNMKQLHDGLAHIFHPLPNVAKEFKPAQSQERLSEIARWIESLQRFIESGGHKIRSKDSLELIIALNEALNKSGEGIRELFYRASDRAKLLVALERLQKDTKSVMVMKEVEEFQDAREDWDAE